MHGGSGREHKSARHMPYMIAPDGMVRRLVAWRGDVIKKIKHLLAYVRKVGDDACTLITQVQRALGAMCVRTSHGGTV